MIPELIAITPDDGRELARWIEPMARAGLPAVLLRELHSAGPAYEALVARLRGVVPLLLVHGGVRGARALVGAGVGLHVPAGRTTTGARTASCHTAEEVRACAAIAIWSPVYITRHGRPALGEEAFVAVAAGRPVLGLGGIDPERHRRLRSRGVAGSAVQGALFDHATPAAAAEVVRRFVG